MPGEAILVRALAADDVRALRRIASDENAAPFHRAAQLFTGLCANDVSVMGQHEGHEAGRALAAYAALATDEIDRIFSTAKPSRAPAPLRPTDSDFDEAARTALTALEPAFA